MASIKSLPSGSFQLCVKNELLPKTLWATFDSFEQAEAYGKQLEGLFAQGIVPVSLLERTIPSREIWKAQVQARWRAVTGGAKPPAAPV